MSSFSQYTPEELGKKLERILAEHVGQERAIERWTLVVEVFGSGADHPRNDDNLQDRAVRAAVQQLRLHGSFVLDMHDGKGRFLARDQHEYKEFRHRYLEPLMARAEVIRAMDKHAQRKWGDILQMQMFDLDTLTIGG